MPLSPAEQDQWNDFACISRALMKLAEVRGQPISQENYCALFRPLFPQNQFGGLHISSVAIITGRLGFGRSFNVLRRYEGVLERHQNGQSILVSSEIHLAANRADIFGHCTVLRDMTAADFHLHDVHRDFVVADWDGKLCTAIVIG